MASFNKVILMGRLTAHPELKQTTSGTTVTTFTLAVDIAKEMGYKKVITYILESENGASLKASNFICEGEAGGTHWTGCRNKGQRIPAEMKKRWVRLL